MAQHLLEMNQSPLHTECVEGRLFGQGVLSAERPLYLSIHHVARRSALYMPWLPPVL